MNIQLDWFGCDPLPKWESQIHLALERFAAMKPISRAVFRVEELEEGRPRHHLSIALSIPGPDVIARSSGHTFDEAMIKLNATVHKTLSMRAMNARQHTGAVRGVKPSHRG